MRYGDLRFSFAHLKRMQDGDVDALAHFAGVQDLIMRAHFVALCHTNTHAKLLVKSLTLRAMLMAVANLFTKVIAFIIRLY